MSPFQRLWNVVRGTRISDELEEELATHLALIEEEGAANGLSPDEARRHARSRFGNPVSYHEQALDGVMARWAENLWKDTCLAVRYLRKSPAFTLAAVLSLALGIGANSAIFTLIDAVLVKPLPVRDPEALVMLGDARQSGVGTGGSGSFHVYSHDLYKHLDDAQIFAGLCAFQSAASSRVSVRRPQATIAEPAGAKLVSGNYFDVLGARAALGRTLMPSDDVAGASPVAVVSFRYWKETLNSDPSAIGSSLELNGVPVSIVGVASAEFYGDTLQPEPPSFWIPIAADRQLDPERSVVDSPDQHWLYLMGRLSPGISPAQAEERLTTSLRNWLLAREGSTLSEERQRGIARSHVELTPGVSGVARTSRAYSTTLRILLGLSLAVLLIACANIANLLLARDRSAASGELIAPGTRREPHAAGLAGIHREPRSGLRRRCARACRRRRGIAASSGPRLRRRRSDSDSHVAGCARVRLYVRASRARPACCSGCSRRSARARISPPSSGHRHVASRERRDLAGIQPRQGAHRWRSRTVARPAGWRRVIRAEPRQSDQPVVRLQERSGPRRRHRSGAGAGRLLAAGTLVPTVERAIERAARGDEREPVALQPVQRLLLGVQHPGGGLRRAARREHQRPLEPCFAALLRDDWHPSAARPCARRT